MATLQGGLLGPDPGALSPAQLEQLRLFKVGAPPTPASVRGQLPRDKGRRQWGGPGGGAREPVVKGRKAGGDP